MLKQKPQRSNEVIQETESLREANELEVLLGNGEKYLNGHVFRSNERTLFQPEQGVVSVAICLATGEEFVTDPLGHHACTLGRFKNFSDIRRHLDS